MSNKYVIRKGEERDLPIIYSLIKDLIGKSDDRFNLSQEGKGSRRVNYREKTPNPQQTATKGFSTVFGNNNNNNNNNSSYKAHNTAIASLCAGKGKNEKC